MESYNSFKFYSTLDYKLKTILLLPEFAEIYFPIGQYNLCLLSESGTNLYGYNKYIQINKECVCFKRFSHKKDNNFVINLFDEHVIILNNTFDFQWLQLSNAIPKS